MINKKNLWFLTLFSLVLVLSVYYVTMPSELLTTNNSAIPNNNDSNQNDVVIKESDIITALRVEADDQMLEEMSSLKQILTDLNVSIEDKNSAFESLKSLNEQKGKETKLENIINEKYQVNSFVKIDADQVRVVVGSNEHSTELANDIMRTVQSEFKDKMYISVQFQIK